MKLSGKNNGFLQISPLSQPNDSGESLPWLPKSAQEMLPAVLRVTGQLAGRLKGSEVLSASWHWNSVYEAHI